MHTLDRPPRAQTQDKPFSVLAWSFMQRDDLKSPDCGDGRTVFTINTYVPHAQADKKNAKGVWQAQHKRHHTLLI